MSGWKEKIILQSQENSDRIIEKATLDAKKIIRDARDTANEKAIAIITDAEKKASKKNAISHDLLVT